MEIFVDLETTGLDPRISHVTTRIISIDGEVFDVFMDGAEEPLSILESRTGETFVAHNAQFDLDFLAENFGYEHEGPIFDTMVAWQMIENGRGVPANLQHVAKSILGVELDKTYQKVDWSAPFLEPDAFKYAAEDTRILQSLHPILERGLRDARLDKLFQLEMILLKTLVASKQRGVRINSEAARLLSKSLHDETEGAIAKLETKGLGINIRSPSQVAEYFKLPDAQEDTMREAYKNSSNPLLGEVMDIRKKLKKKSTVDKQLLDRIAYDGRIHPSLLQTFTQTGRLSSREPNLQNQDRGKDIRGLFVPEDGYKFIIADYSQLELRLAALLSKDDAMLGAYRAGRDLHKETQLRIFGEPATAEEEKTTRTLSKNINFAFVFGGGHKQLPPFAAKQGVEIDEATAKEYHKEFHAAYPILSRYHRRVGTSKDQYVYSILGRRRWIEPGEMYSTRINTAVQASAADGMKLTMVDLHKNHGLLPVLSIHDEVIVEVPENQAEDALDIVVKMMINCMYRATKQSVTKPTVAVEVEGGIADSWAEK